jgi:hypothetical protein
MPVRLGDVQFSDWVSLPMEGGWTDTFVFRVSATACLPPFAYAPLIRRLAARKTRLLRPSLSLWIQVDAPGEWFAAELRRSLRGLLVPYAVTNGRVPEYVDFSFNPWLGHSNTGRPPEIDMPIEGVSGAELLCLQALGRMIKGEMDEIASLTGLAVDVVETTLRELEKQELIIFKVGQRIVRRRGYIPEDDPYPLWHLKRQGLSIALRSWGIPKKLACPERWERHLYHIATKHRHIGRQSVSWLQTRWGQDAEIWTGWAEVGIPRLRAIPDALAWGQMNGQETLFWVEVGDDHKSRIQIEQKMQMRMNDALRLSRRTGMNSVFILLGPRWVQNATRWAAIDDLPLFLEDWKKCGM